MLEFTNTGIFYSISSRNSLYIIPQDQFLRDLFPKTDDPNYQFALLFKKFGLNTNEYKNFNDQDYLTDSADNILRNLLTLINLSQTGKYFYTLLNGEIKKRTIISLNSIITYFPSPFKADNLSIFYLYCNKNNDHLSLGINLLRVNEDDRKICIDSKGLYKELSNLCTAFIQNTDDYDKINSVCRALQVESKSFENIFSVKNIAMLRLLLMDLSINNHCSFWTLDDCFLQAIHSLYTSLKCRIILEIRINTADKILLKNIEDNFSTHADLTSVFAESKVSDEVLQYLRSCTSFLHAFGLPTLTSKALQQLIFQVNCGFSNESIIPLDIISNESLNIKYQQFL
jgi:hypothetical protein